MDKCCGADVNTLAQTSVQGVDLNYTVDMFVLDTGLSFPVMTAVFYYVGSTSVAMFFFTLTFLLKWHTSIRPLPAYLSLPLLSPPLSVPLPPSPPPSQALVIIQHHLFVFKIRTAQLLEGQFWHVLSNCSFFTSSDTVPAGPQVSAGEHTLSSPVCTLLFFHYNIWPNGPNLRGGDQYWAMDLWVLAHTERIQVFI